ncbi:Adenylate cyclase type 1 [Homalodisca vitripennis]|nr:Adenylate cyclase type 1 [Homalodisca vitripennis]
MVVKTSCDTSNEWVPPIARKVTLSNRHLSDRQPLLFNTLQVRSALGAAQRRKLSFKNVSSVVVQLLHSIKYSVEVPFSNMAAGADLKANTARKDAVSVCRLHTKAHSQASLLVLHTRTTIKNTNIGSQPRRSRRFRPNTTNTTSGAHGGIVQSRTEVDLILTDFDKDKREAIV